MKTSTCACSRLLSATLPVGILAGILSLATANATTRNWTGTDPANCLWSNTALWGGILPGPTDDAWVNVTNARIAVDSTVAATANQLIIGRTVPGAQMTITGGTITASNEIFAGQYAGSSGSILMSGGLITGSNNMTIGSAGMGELFMTGGTINLSKSLLVARYTGTSTEGYVDLYSSTVNADALTIGVSGTMVMDNSTLTLNGDRRSTINGYLTSGALSPYWGSSLEPIAVSYNSSSNKTTVQAPNGRQGGILAFGTSVYGQRSITYDYTGVRRILPAPAPGIHPRIYFNAEELPDIRARLQNTAAGQEAFRMVQLYTSILRNGRSIAYDSQPASFKTMPDGTARISNPGLYDRSAVYNELITGGTNQISAMANDGTGLLCLAGEMALEAFECQVNAGQPGVSTRATNLAQALNTWATWALTQPDLATVPSKFGHHISALTYDMSYGSMTSAQQANVRKALAVMMSGYINYYYGVGFAPQSSTSNWCALDTYKFILATALEGEVTTSDGGFSSATLDTYIQNAASSLHKFFTYGWWQNGAPYEGQGKNYTFAAHLIPLARRGYDFFGHPCVRNYASDWMSVMLQPYGYSFTSYDVLGGTGLNNEKGRQYLNPADYIGQKWMYPNDVGMDFAWRNYVNTEYKDSSGNWQTFLDYRDTKFGLRSNYGHYLLPAAIFASDCSTDSWQSQNAAALGGLDFLDTQGSTLVSRSGFDKDATQLLVHIRQDLGGHTNADRNQFDLSALGRIFMNYDTGGTNSNLQGSDYHSLVLVDDQAMYVTPKEGNKCRVPAKLAAWSLGSNASFVTGDATYAYSYAWTWDHNSDGSPKLDSGYAAEAATFNDFRRSNNKLPEAYASTAFWNFPNWDAAVPTVEGIQRQPYNPMRQVYRTAGLVRGQKPYVLIVDDVRKDDLAHTYKWIASVAEDLTLVSGTLLPPGCNPNTDVVLQEPTATGNRGLLVRILQADGSPAQPTSTIGSPLAYLQTITDAIGETYNRLVIERDNVVQPNFRVLLFPFRAGDALPATSQSNNTLTITIGSQVDTCVFYPRTASIGGQVATMSEFTLSRGGTTLLDYRNQIEPATLR